MKYVTQTVPRMIPTMTNVPDEMGGWGGGGEACVIKSSGLDGTAQ